MCRNIFAAYRCCRRPPHLLKPLLTITGRLSISAKRFKDDASILLCCHGNIIHARVSWQKTIMNLLWYLSLLDPKVKSFLLLNTFCTTFVVLQADLQTRMAEEQGRTEGVAGVLSQLDGLPGELWVTVHSSKTNRSRTNFYWAEPLIMYNV